jgi:transcriptional regulator with XRE-family HTH domain
MGDITREQKKEFARLIYFQEPGISQKEMAARVGISEVTIGKWITKEGWREMQKSLLTSKAEQLSMLYTSLDKFNQSIRERKESPYPTNKEADTLIKMTAAIRNLETETSIAEKIETAKAFLQFLRKIGPQYMQFSKDVARLLDAYIKSCL